MERCPTCGFLLPEGPNRNCYNCLGRENDAKRHGGRPPVSFAKQKQWNEMRLAGESQDTLAAEITPDKVEPSNSQELLEETSDSLRAARQGVNRMLREIYGEDRLLSDLLREAGLSRTDINRLRHNYLELFFKRLIPAWRKQWAKKLSPLACELLCWRYELDGRPRLSRHSMARQFDMSEDQVELKIDEALQALRFRSRQQELEKLTTRAARAVLVNPS